MYKEKIEQFLHSFVSASDAQLLSIEVEEVDTMCKVRIETTNNGFFIGKNGRTLKHIEVILNTMVKVENKDKHVQFNVGDYREMHEQQLKQLAIEKAKYVSKTGRIYAFEPMNSYERRLIHTAISESVFGILVKTESVGEGKERHTILKSK